MTFLCGGGYTLIVFFFKRFFIFLFFFYSVLLQAQEKNLFVEKVKNAYGYFGFPAWSPDGSIFAGVQEDKIILYGSDDLMPKKIFEPFSSENRNTFVASMEFSRNGKKMLAVRSCRSIGVYDVDSGALTDLIPSDKSSAEAAVFGEEGFSVVFPYDGKNLFEYYRLLASNSYLLNKKIDFNKEIVFLSRTDDSKCLIVSTSDSKFHLVANSDGIYQNIAEYSWNVNSGVYPKISSDGSAFLSSMLQDKLVVAHFNGLEESTSPNLTEITVPEGLSGDACFSSGGKYIVLGTKNNCLCVFDAGSGNLIKTLSLGKSESFSAGTFSPDGEKILFTTKKGNLYLWKWLADDSGLELFPEEPDSEETPLKDGSGKISAASGSGSSVGDSGSTSAGTSGKLPVSSDNRRKEGFYADLQLDCATVPEPFLFAVGADFSFISCDVLKPFFIGGRIRPFVAFPKDNFPYNYTLNGEDLDSPCLSGIGFSVPFGIFILPFSDKDIAVGAEVSAGASLLYLWNRKIGADFYSSGIFPSFNFSGRIQLEFKFLSFFAGASWDSILKFCASAGAGVCFRLDRKK